MLWTLDEKQWKVSCKFRLLAVVVVLLYVHIKVNNLLIYISIYYSLSWKNGSVVKSSYACRGPDSIPSTHTVLRNHHNLVLWDPMPSSDFLGYEVHTWCTYIHAGTHKIKWINLFLKLPYFASFFIDLLSYTFFSAVFLSPPTLSWSPHSQFTQESLPFCTSHVD